MIKRYKEIFFGLLLGLAMWVADAQMHAMMPANSANAQASLVEEIFSPDDLPLTIRTLYVSFALLVGWLLWRSNQQERIANTPVRQEEIFYCQISYPATLISEAAMKLLRGGEWNPERVEAFNRINHHARQIENSRNTLPRYSDTIALDSPATSVIEAEVKSWWERLNAVNVTRAVASVSLMVSVAFGVRFVTVLFVYDEQLMSTRGDFEFGWEVGRVAKSLVNGHGFSSPLWGETGPTAWLTPVYALLLAGVFTIFGTYTTASAIVILSLNSLFSALTIIPLTRIAHKIFGGKIAVGVGWAWALFPYAIFIAAFRVWGECLDALLLTLVFLQALRLAESERLSLWFSCGALVGFAALTNPNTLSVMPGLWGWACYRLRHRGVRWKTPLLAALIVLLLVVTPWFVRNYAAFHQFVPFRSNFWLEFQLGNNQEAITMKTGDAHPASHPQELTEYQRLGELKYMQVKREQSLAYIATHPGAFVRLTLRRIVSVWTGFWSLNPAYLASEPLQVPFVFFSTTLTLLMALGLFVVWHQHYEALAPLAVILVCQPLAYYLTHPALEYRHAIDPIILLLAACGTACVLSWGQKKTIATTLNCISEKEQKTNDISFL